MLLIVLSGLVLIKNKTFVNKVYYQTILDNANGLRSKPPIFFKGFQIGRIDDFELDSATNNILVKFYIFEDHTDKIIRYAVISRIENLVLGSNSQYEILLPQRDLIAQLEPLQEGGLVPFINSELGQEYAKKGQIAANLDSIESILASVNNVLLNLQKESSSEAGAIFNILGKFSKLADSLLVMAQQAEDDQLISEFKKTVIALQALIDTTNSSVIEVEKDFDIAADFFKDAQEVSKHADRVLEEYENPSDILSRASEYKIPGMIDNVDTNLLYLQDILKEVHLQREQLAEAIITLNKTLSVFDKTLEGINNNPLFKDGIEPENNADISIEVNEN